VAAIPPAVKIDIISDRTQTIRAAVEDVQSTLLLTIFLVVMVIFLFLRSFWATVIPAVTVPLALLGACALMWLFGYTLDHLDVQEFLENYRPQHARTPTPPQASRLLCGGTRINRGAWRAKTSLNSATVARGFGVRPDGRR